MLRRNGGTSLNTERLYDLLRKLTLTGQIDAVILRAGLPPEQITAAPAPVAQRALDILRIAEQSGPGMLAKIADAVVKEAPWIEDAHRSSHEPGHERPDIRAVAEQPEAASRHHRARPGAGASMADADSQILALADRPAEPNRFLEAPRIAVSDSVELMREVDASASACVWREPATGMCFVWVPPGQFLMGMSKILGARGFDTDAQDAAIPAHEVELPHGVWMGQYPVTNAEYGSFLEETKRDAPPDWQNGRFNAPAKPVVSVSFEDALAFCAWLTERAGVQEGHVFDLPTEAEWEHASRGSDARRYPWGDADPEPKLACFGLPLDSGAPAAKEEHPAGKSPFGCQDMAGNVWEWCLDAWRDSYGDTNSKLVNPCHPGPPGTPRVVRGGSWNDHAGNLRCAIRNGRGPGSRRQFVGFRVVCRAFHQPWLVDS